MQSRLVNIFFFYTHKLVQRRAIRPSVLYIILSFLAIIGLMPFAWMVSGAMKAPGDIFTYPIQWIPKQIMFIENVKSVFNLIPFGLYYLNSLLVTTVVMFTHLFFCALAGYSFAKYNFVGKQFFFIYILIRMMIPFQVIIVPLFILVKNLGLLDSYFALIFPMLMSAFGIFLMRQYISTIPNDYIDAARIDGCNEFLIFLKVIIPLSKPALATLAILTFTQTWGSFYWPLVAISKECYRTLPLGLMMLQSQYSTYWPELMTAAFLTCLPLIALVAIFSKQFMSMVILSGVKG